MNDLSAVRAAEPQLDRRRHGRYSAFLSVAADILTWLSSVAGTIGRHRRRAKAIGDLQQLDDKMLADIGLHRSEIRSAVLEAEQNGRFDRRRSR
jgi:uncharacterized protein YjiS (DUF1127 family)